MSLVSPPKNSRRRERLKRKLNFDILASARHLVVRGEAVAVRTERTGNVHDLRVAKCLLQAVADGVVIVFRFNDGNRNTRLLVEDIIRKFLLLFISACNVSPNDHRTRRKRDLAPNLRHLIPSGPLDCRRYQKIADVDFCESPFV